MLRTSAFILIIIFAALLIFQVLLALGAPLGAAAWGGAYTVLPASLRVGSAVSAGVFLLAILVVLEFLGVVRVFKRAHVVRGFLFVFAGLFLLSAAGNVVSSSAWESFLMFPVALIASGLCFLLASKR